MKLSIITAVHNQLPMNRIYVEELRRRTDLPYELIVVDNASTDGSREFFESQGATVIANPANYSYPRCQNQGLAVATGDVHYLEPGQSPLHDLLTCIRHRTSLERADGLLRGNAEYTFRSPAEMAMKSEVSSHNRISAGGSRRVTSAIRCLRAR